MNPLPPSGSLVVVSLCFAAIGCSAKSASSKTTETEEDTAGQGEVQSSDGEASPAVEDAEQPAMSAGAPNKPETESGSSVPDTSEPHTGNPEGTCAIPNEAKAASAENPDIVIGSGNPASCTSEAVVEAVGKGGVITFDCGPEPITIVLKQTAKVFNDTGPEVVLDGGGKVTLSGAGERRILYMNTCDEAQGFTTPMCQNQDHPRLTVQNLTFVEGNASGDEFEGGGAIFVRGGRFRIINSRFFSNRCDDVGPDVGGAAVRVLSQHEGRPVFVVNSTFGDVGLGNECSNGGGLSSIGVSYAVFNSVFRHNQAIGRGANPAKPGTPGGGNGGAIYNDGDRFTLELCGTVIEDNSANEGGGAIFFVSNDRSGTLKITDSALKRNTSGEFETEGYPGIFILADGPPIVTGSSIE